MVQLTRIYTRGGDKGKTSLGNGNRVPKGALRVEAYGTVDETNATIGMARQFCAGNGDSEADIDAMLARIQNDLFDLGADLCTPLPAEGEDDQEYALRMTDSQVERLEQEIDHLNARLQPLKSFILPGGSALAAHLHYARTVSRRAERLIATLADEEPVNGAALRYANRLSDHLFVLSRIANKNGENDVLWVPGQGR